MGSAGPKPAPSLIRELFSVARAGRRLSEGLGASLGLPLRMFGPDAVLPKRCCEISLGSLGA